MKVFFFFFFPDTMMNHEEFGNSLTNCSNLSDSTGYWSTIFPRDKKLDLLKQWLIDSGISQSFSLNTKETHKSTTN